MTHRRLIKSSFCCILRRGEISEPLLLFYKHCHVTNGEWTAVSCKIICQTWCNIFTTEHIFHHVVYIYYAFCNIRLWWPAHVEKKIELYLT